MDSQNCDFGKLDVGTVFTYHDQTYRKETDDLAVMLKWVTGEEVVEERILHRFFAEIVVQVPGESEET